MCLEGEGAVGGRVFVQLLIQWQGQGNGDGGGVSTRDGGARGGERRGVKGVGRGKRKELTEIMFTCVSIRKEL